jgi:hypothetical protein
VDEEVRWSMEITKKDVLVVFGTVDGEEAIYGFRPCGVSESFSDYQKALYEYIVKYYREVVSVSLDEDTWLTIYVKK